MRKRSYRYDLAVQWGSTSQDTRLAEIEAIMSAPPNDFYYYVADRVNKGTAAHILNLVRVSKTFSELADYLQAGVLRARPGVGKATEEKVLKHIIGYVAHRMSILTKEAPDAR